MRHSINFIFLLLLSFVVYSQGRVTVPVRKFTQKNGLSSYNIRKVIQDKWGFIWAGTQDGLNKFDGKSIINYTKSSPEKNKISGTDVRELIEDTSQNLIWVLPGEVGINAINSITGDVKVSARIPYTNNDDWNISMLKNKDEIWIGTSTGIKIYDIPKKKFELSPLLPEKQESSIGFAVRSLAKDENGKIWACYDRYGIVIYDGFTKKVIKEIRLSELNDHLKSNEIRFLNYISIKGAFLFATNQGLRKVSYTPLYDVKVDNYPCQSLPVLNTSSIESIALEKKGNVLISGFSKLFRFDVTLTNYVVLEEASRLGETDWLNAVQSILIDSEDNIWLGCQEGLAFVSGNINPFQRYNYDNRNNIKLDHVRSIYPLRNGDILAGLRNGIVHISKESYKYTKFDTGHLYHHIYQDQKGLIHVSRPDGMFIFNNGKLVPIAEIYPEFSSYSSVAINSHLFINDTLVILGSENNNGILIWNPSRKTVRKMEQGPGENGLSSNIVNNIYRNSKGDIWVLSDNVISVLSENLKRKKELLLIDKNTQLHFKLFFDMCEAGGYYWITSYGSGILQLDSSYKIIKVFSTSNGLSNDGVYQIYNLSNKNLLITSNNGLSVLDINNYKFKSFFEEDGLHANGFEEVCGLAKDGLIYAGGVNGFTVIDPSKFSLNKVIPTFYYTNVNYHIKNKTGTGSRSIDTFNFKMNYLRVPNNWLQINISFIGLNYINPNRVVYQYRIKEKDASWINQGSQNFINLIGLSPGTYTLEVKAANEDGYWSDPRQLILIIEPKWYQTLFFKIAVLFAVGALFYVFYRYRISQIKQQHLIRKNISSDLHDDIGSTLNTIKVLTHLAKRNTNKEEYWVQIEYSLTEATTGLRDMIWVLDDSKDTVSELIDRIEKFAIPITRANDTNFRSEVKVDSDDQLLTKPEKRNLLLMSKEIINNSIKYANCKNIDLLFLQHKNKRTLLIKDDGKGFDSSINSEGNGLKNLFHRAQQIGYQVEIISSLGNGTLVKIEKK
ncbi:histidine kinase [Chitinophagaceae bacterium LB-8]|uniref:Histidine kinase n=1 Tax=Paraflavisolibacter caeni TaxID=2982496 RepID=A0A9X2XY92_9BACT|nr:sensor histidine kinase [Paraflavisolibacter caeni]MCU7549843.1 histidine kinase [Paraflavisolibacter caeni]